MYAVTPVATLVSDPNCSRNNQKCLNGKLKLWHSETSHTYMRDQQKIFI